MASRSLSWRCSSLSPLITRGRAGRLAGIRGRTDRLRRADGDRRRWPRQLARRPCLASRLDQRGFPAARLPRACCHRLGACRSSRGARLHWRLRRRSHSQPGNRGQRREGARHPEAEVNSSVFSVFFLFGVVAIDFLEPLDWQITVGVNSLTVVGCAGGIALLGSKLRSLDLVRRLGSGAGALPRSSSRLSWWIKSNHCAPMILAATKRSRCSSGVVVHRPLPVRSLEPTDGPPIALGRTRWAGERRRNANSPHLTAWARSSRRGRRPGIEAASALPASWEVITARHGTCPSASRCSTQRQPSDPVGAAPWPRTDRRDLLKVSPGASMSSRPGATR